MDVFEFILIPTSIIIGLGMANMLTGAVRLLHHRQDIRYSLTHAAWTLFVFFMMVVYWWTVVFGWKDWEHWNILLFLFLLIYAITLYLWSAILYPGDVPEAWDLQQHFIGMRRWFFSVPFRRSMQTEWLPWVSASVEPRPCTWVPAIPN